MNREFYYTSMLLSFLAIIFNKKIIDFIYKKCKEYNKKIEQKKILRSDTVKFLNSEGYEFVKYNGYEYEFRNKNLKHYSENFCDVNSWGVFHFPSYQVTKEYDKKFHKWLELNKTK